VGLRRCWDGGRPAYRWGDRGPAHAYDAADPSSRRLALRLAQADAPGRRRRVGDADPRDPRWSIGEPGAPSSRGLQALLRRWIVGELRPVYRAVVAAGRAWAARQAERAVVADAVGLSAAEAVDLSLALRRALDDARRRGGGLPPGVEREVERAARRSSAAARRRLVDLGADRERLAAALGVPVRESLALTSPLSPGEQEAFRRWVSGVAVESPTGLRVTGLAKIRKLPQEAVQGLENWIVPTRLEGRRWDTIADELQARFAIEPRHAELVARDQIGKLNGAITEATQVEAGVEEYTWRTSGDRRVRDLHDDLADTTHRHDAPPESGTDGERLPPGLPIQCRCWADPVIPDRLIP
jgi:SPP1 gp7 family putative phage head morphogenesis protein